MFKKIIFVAVLMVLISTGAWAQGKYSIKEMTPEVKQALDARKERFNQVRSLKASGILGETNQGYIKVLQDDANASMIAAQENQDRKIIYEIIAKQNGLESALSTIESAFAQVQRDKAEAGDKIQTADGQWISK